MAEMDNAKHAEGKTPTNGMEDAVCETALPAEFEQPFAAAMFRR